MNYQEQLASIEDLNEARTFRVEEFIPAAKSPCCSKQLRALMWRLDQNYLNYIHNRRENSISPSTYLSIGRVFVNRVHEKEQDLRRQQEARETAMRFIESAQRPDPLLPPNAHRRLSAMSQALLRFAAGTPVPQRPACVDEMVMTPEEYLQAVQTHRPLLDAYRLVPGHPA